MLCFRGGWLFDVFWKVWVWEEFFCDFGFGNCFFLGLKIFEEGVWGCVRGYFVFSFVLYFLVFRYWKSRVIGI